MDRIVKLLIIFFLLCTPCYSGVAITDDAEVSYGSGATVDDITVFSAAFWIKVDTFAAEWLFEKWSGSDGWVFEFSNADADGDNNDLQWWCENDPEPATPHGTWTVYNIIPSGEWHHIAITFDRTDLSTNDPTFYVDGSEVALDVDTQPDDGACTSDAAANFRLHADTPSSLVYTIEDFAVWDTTLLTATEIAQLASSRVARSALQFNSANLVFYTPFDGNADGTDLDSATLKDISSAGLDGTASKSNGTITAKAGEVLSYP